MPSGLPDVDTVASLGGIQVNGGPVDDPSTDIDIDNWMLVKMNTAGASQTLVRAWCTFLGNATAPTDPASNIHGAVWGNGAGVKPTPARTSAGLYTLTWLTTIQDALGQTHTVNIRGVHRPNIGGPTLYHAQADITSANIITIRVWNSSNTLTDPVGLPVFVAWW